MIFLDSKVLSKPLTFKKIFPWMNRHSRESGNLGKSKGYGFLLQFIPGQGAGAGMTELWTM